MADRPPALVVIATFDDLMEAHVARGLLDANGIATLLADQHILGVLPSISGRVGGIKLQVTARDAALATELLENPVAADEDMDGSEPDW